MSSASDVPTRPTVLLVDDHDDSAEMYAVALRLAGWLTFHTRDGLDALTWALNDPPDAIVISSLLRGTVDGFRVSRLLRASHRTRGIAIILTGCDLPSDEDRAWRAGCDSFLPIPCLPQHLANELFRLLATRAAAAGTTAPVNRWL